MRNKDYNISDLMVAISALCYFTSLVGVSVAMICKASAIVIVPLLLLLTTSLITWLIGYKING